MEIYIILAAFFIFSFSGFLFINTRLSDKYIIKSLSKKWLVYLILTVIQLFLIETKTYQYFAILIFIIGFYEIKKISKSVKIMTNGLLIYFVFGLIFIQFFNEIDMKTQQFLFVIVLTIDGYAQLFGQLFGKTKMFPKISPNKSLEGMFGGIIVVIITTLFLNQIFDCQLNKLIIFSFSITIFAIFGDLFASYFKRLNAVKDFSNILPAHGGILDRFDSLIFASFGFYFVQKINFSGNILIFANYSILFLMIFLVAEFLYHSLKCKVEISRKWVHFTSGICCLSFPYYINNHLVVMILCANFILILILSFRFNFLKSINNIDRKSFGSFLFPVSIYICFVSFQYFQNQKIYFYLPIIILTICDPMAALVGKKFPFGKYKIGKDYKTLMGSTAFFISCFMILFASFYYFDNLKSISKIIILSLIISITTTFTEAFSKNGFDNLTIPVCVLLGLILI